MHILIIILLVLSLVFLLVAAVAGYAAAATVVAGDQRPTGWVRTNFLALGLAVYLLVVLLEALGVR